MSHKPSGRFAAEIKCFGKCQHLGTFDTAVEAALAYARAEADEEEQEQEEEGEEKVVEKAEGWRLHLSCSNYTGYKGVCQKANGRFEVKIRLDGKDSYLGALRRAPAHSERHSRAAGAPRNL